MSVDPEPDLAASPAVRRWFEHTGYEGKERRNQVLELLAGFCRATGQTPEQLVESCFRTTDEGAKKISIKGRRAMEAAITSYVAERGETGYAATVAGNMLRSFLIHNGVYMQGRPSID